MSDIVVDWRTDGVKAVNIRAKKKENDTDGKGNWRFHSKVEKLMSKLSWSPPDGLLPLLLRESSESREMMEQLETLQPQAPEKSSSHSDPVDIIKYL